MLFRRYIQKVFLKALGKRVRRVCVCGGFLCFHYFDVAFTIWASEKTLSLSFSRAMVTTITSHLSRARVVDPILHRTAHHTQKKYSPMILFFFRT
jgi:hypothetical protein